MVHLAHYAESFCLLSNQCFRMIQAEDGTGHAQDCPYITEWPGRFQDAAGQRQAAHSERPVAMLTQPEDISNLRIAVAMMVGGIIAFVTAALLGRYGFRWSLSYALGIGAIVAFSTMGSTVITARQRHRRWFRGG